MAGNIAIYFPDKHLKQRGLSEPIHTCLNIPRFWLCRRECQNWAVSFLIREPGLEGTHKIANPLLPVSSPDLSPGACRAAEPAELRLQPLLPAQQCTPITPPRQAGQRKCWIWTPPVQPTLWSSLKTGILLVDFLFICCSRPYVKHLVCSCDSLEVHLAALSRAGCTRASQQTDQKTENLCTKRLLLPRTIEYDWNIKEFLVTVWGKERIIC